MPVPGGWDSSKTDATTRNNQNASTGTQGPSTYGISVAGYGQYPLGGQYSISSYVTPNDSARNGQQIFPGWEISIETV